MRESRSFHVFIPPNLGNAILSKKSNFLVPRGWWEGGCCSVVKKRKRREMGSRRVRLNESWTLAGSFIKKYLDGNETLPFCTNLLNARCKEREKLKDKTSSRSDTHEKLAVSLLVL